MLIQHALQPGCGGLLGADDNEARRRPFRRCQRTSPVTLIFCSLRPISCTHRMHHPIGYCLTQNRCIHSGSLSPPGKMELICMLYIHISPLFSSPLCRCGVFYGFIIVGSSRIVQNTPGLMQKPLLNLVGSSPLALTGTSPDLPLTGSWAVSGQKYNLA